jgi:hypothetical protein
MATKLQSAILLLSFLVYYFDTTAAVSHNMKQQGQTCCKKMSIKHKMPAKCPQKPKDCTKDCLNCPLTFTTTFTPRISVSCLFFPLHTSFCVFDEMFLSYFHTEAWKPPDRA